MPSTRSRTRPHRVTRRGRMTMKRRLQLNSMKPIPGAQGNSRVYNYRPPRPLVQHGSLPFAPIFKVKLPYAQTGSIQAPSTSLVNTYTFRLNSLFDPDLSGVGHQPQQYDQLTGIYNSYLVTGCRVDLTFTNPSIDGIYVGYNLAGRPNALFLDSSDSVQNQTIDVAKERYKCILQPLNNTGSQVKRMSVYVPINKLVGISKSAYMDDKLTYGATIGSNPNASANIEVSAWSSVAATAIDVTYSIRLTYYAIMYDMRNQATS